MTTSRHAGGRRLRHGTAILTATALAVLVPAASVATKPPTGAHKAIAFYSREAALFAKIPGAKVVETGYFFGKRRGAGVTFTWGRPPKSGYVAQTATILERLSDGRIVAYFAKLTGQGLPRLRIVMSGGSVFLSTKRCWRRASDGSSPLGNGDTYLFNDGGATFLPLARSGRRTSTTLTYVWSKGSQAQETDSFTPGKMPRVAIDINVSGAETLHVTKVITPLATAPALPVPSPPRIPVPKPLCAS